MFPRFAFARSGTRALAPFSLLTLAAFVACSDAATAPTKSNGGTTTVSGTVDTSHAASPTPAPTPTPPPAPTPPPTPPTSNASNALAGATLYVDPSSSARQTADAWRASRPSDAAEMDKIAAQSQAKWFGDWNADIAGDVRAATTTALANGSVPVYVAYNIPERDCGSFSAGGAPTAAAYQQWIDGFANGIGAHRAVVILEPDAVAGMDCLSPADQQTRLTLIAYAISAFSRLGATAVYVDAGHPQWQSAATMASRLRAAGVTNANGFSLNVSNFVSDADNIAYGQQLSALIGDKHFVIDSSRNGLGPTADAQWCNPSGRAIGTRPTVQTGVTHLDAFLWIKTPGESDGACNGGPNAGAWWPDYALGLAQRAAF